ncbi:hypothetical protein Tco_0570874 [Tanacetum coccineum]
MVAYLQKSEGSEGFHQIIDFLNASHIQYALIENPTIYVSFIKQFWKTTTARTSANGEAELTARIDGQVKTITEASLRRQLKLEDNGGITTLPNSEIFEQLALMGHSVPPSTSQPPNTQPTPDAEEAVPIPYESPLHSVHSLGRDDGRLSLNELTNLCTSLSKKVEGLESELKQKNRHIEKISDDTEVVLEEEEPTELVEDQEGVLKRKKDKGKGIMTEPKPEKKTKKQLEQERLGHEEAVRLQEQLNEEETQRIARDAEIARQLHEEINKAGQERVVAKDDQAHVINWSDLAVLRYHAQLNRPYSIAKVRKNMVMYLKNQGGYKMNYFKGIKYKYIRLIFEKVWDQIQSFAPMDSEKEKGSEKKGSRKKSLAMKRAGEKQSEESIKRQKIEDDIDKEELKAYLDLVPKEEFAMEIEFLDGGSKNYKIFSEMLDDLIDKL